MGKWHSLTSVMMTMGRGGDIFLYSVSDDDYGVGGEHFFSLRFPTLNHSGIFHMCSHPISKIKRTAALTHPLTPHVTMAGLLSRDYTPETVCLLTLFREGLEITEWKLESRCWTKNCW